METTKQCKQCSEVKDIQCFYKHSSMKDGRVSKCDTCFKEAVKKAKQRRVAKKNKFK